MAVLVTGDEGWVISHESYIKSIYQRTNYFDEIKSYQYNPTLFDIRTPFVNSKHVGGKLNKSIEGEVETVEKAHNNLYELHRSLYGFPKSLQPENNRSAKAVADTFYSNSTCSTNVKFHGGNRSQEPLVSKIGDELYLIPGNCLFYCDDIANISNHLKNEKFDLIILDPPWWNKYIRRKRKKSLKFSYNMVYDIELSNIPINELLNRDGIVGVWCTNAPSHINSVLTELFPAWDIQFITQWFWLKVTKLGKPICEFSQALGKQPFERIIFGAKRNVARVLKGPEREKVIMSIPSSIHSHKPPLCELLKPYLPNEPKCLELFARYLLPRWTSYGNEVLKLQQMSLYREDYPQEKS